MAVDVLSGPKTTRAREAPTVLVGIQMPGGAVVVFALPGPQRGALKLRTPAATGCVRALVSARSGMRRAAPFILYLVCVGFAGSATKAVAQAPLFECRVEGRFRTLDGPSPAPFSTVPPWQRESDGRFIFDAESGLLHWRDREIMMPVSAVFHITKRGDDAGEDWFASLSNGFVTATVRVRAWVHPPRFTMVNFSGDLLSGFCSR
ncbi:hypothetical protein [Falsiroseomonas sp. E2-1-a4]|uniref:hypothetical protein n=1 Tax=Falsiroseomonas sp. E2-1-a4 TaxID=3239299 RepID=UPI003F31669D